MLNREEMYLYIQTTTGNLYSSLFETPIFKKICDAFYDLLYCKNLNLEYAEVKQVYLEYLQEWEHLKSNMVVAAPKVDEEKERMRKLYFESQEYIKGLI